MLRLFSPCITVGWQLIGPAPISFKELTQGVELRLKGGVLSWSIRPGEGCILSLGPVPGRFASRSIATGEGAAGTPGTTLPGR